MACSALGPQQTISVVIAGLGPAAIHGAMRSPRRVTMDARDEARA
jgi:hypothetical protein